MKVTDRHTFIMAYQDTFKESILRIEEKYDPGKEFVGYIVQLNEGVNKEEFETSTVIFINHNCDFEESFNLWINGFGNDRDTRISVNSEYDGIDGGYIVGGEPVLFTIEIEGKATHSVIKFEDEGEPVQYGIYEDDEYRGKISPVYIDGNLRWQGTASLDLNVVKIIGEHIARTDLQQ
jgi:hypothetical protein